MIKYILIISLFSVSFFSCKNQEGKTLSQISELSAQGKTINFDALDFKDLIRDIKKMKKVTEKPVLMMPAISVLCRAPTKEEIEKDNLRQGPHKDHFIDVYVNDVGSEEMTTKSNPDFPVGTIIIKEKIKAENLKSSKKRKVELYTLMIKRDKGYNPDCGDWEFAAVDGELKNVSRGKIENCIGCHMPQKNVGYIFRADYFTHKQMEKLK